MDFDVRYMTKHACLSFGDVLLYENRRGTHSPVQHAGMFFFSSGHRSIAHVMLHEIFCIAVGDRQALGCLICDISLWAFVEFVCRSNTVESC